MNVTETTTTSLSVAWNTYYLVQSQYLTVYKVTPETLIYTASPSGTTYNAFPLLPNTQYRIEIDIVYRDAQNEHDLNAHEEITAFTDDMVVTFINKTASTIEVGWNKGQGDNYKITVKKNPRTTDTLEQTIDNIVNIDPTTSIIIENLPEYKEYSILIEVIYNSNVLESEDIIQTTNWSSLYDKDNVLTQNYIGYFHLVPKWHTTLERSKLTVTKDPYGSNTFVMQKYVTNFDNYIIRDLDEDTYYKVKIECYLDGSDNIISHTIEHVYWTNFTNGGYPLTEDLTPHIEYTTNLDKRVLESKEIESTLENDIQLFINTHNVDIYYTSDESTPDKTKLFDIRYPRHNNTVLYEYRVPIKVMVYPPKDVYFPPVVLKATGLPKIVDIYFTLGFGKYRWAYISNNVYVKGEYIRKTNTTTRCRVYNNGKSVLDIVKTPSTPYGYESYFLPL